ncbi:MAG TPA: alpha/beta hydrolase [Rhodanobacteraceae bacterium]|nr:alpha/beta hydrolase [Rhodanobacteraceae bacterium]
MSEDDSVLSRAARPPDAAVAYGADRDQVADVRFGDARADARPLVLILHGGFWRPEYDREHTGPMAEAIADAGWTVASVEFRRISGKPEATLDDVATSLATLPAKIERHDGRVVLMGHSAGGHLALWVASVRPQPSLAGVLALAPVADLRLADALNLGNGATRLFLGVDPATRGDLDPRRLASPNAPVTIVHGVRDETVPIEVGRSYADAHRATKLVAVEGADHYGPIDPLTSTFEIVLDELGALSRAGS